MTHSSGVGLPACCTGKDAPCPCCDRWRQAMQAREREFQQQLNQYHHLHHQQQQHPPAQQAHAAGPAGPTWPADQCNFTGVPDLEQSLDLDCCPLEAMDHASSRVSRRSSADPHHTYHMHDAAHGGHSHGGHAHGGEHEMATSSSSFTQSAADGAGCAWPTLGSPYIAVHEACPTAPALSLCASSSAACAPTLSLSQQFLAGNGAAVDFTRLHHAAANGLEFTPPASSSPDASAELVPFGGAPVGMFTDDPAIHFHHHHHAHVHPSALSQAAHVHCTEEQNLDQQQRVDHVHSKACNPQVHWQFASADNVLHDHTLPLLARPASASPLAVTAAAAAASATTGATKDEPVTALAVPMKVEPTGVNSAANGTVGAVGPPTILPCSRVHTFPPAFRFHPYGNNGVSPTNSVARVSAVAAEAAPAGAPASNCHQCKVKKYSATVIQCTAVHEVTVRRSKPMCCVQKKKCAKKYCTTCLAKHYGLQLEQLDRASWVCPGCLGHCNCAACTSKSRALGEAPLLTEMQTTHTHHQHLAHTTTTTYGYAAAANQPTAAAATGGGGGTIEGDMQMVHKMSLQENHAQTL